jgi:hypothetical protein
MRVSPIDVPSAMSGHLYLINPTFICLIKHKQEHMEGDNRLRTDVMGCLTPSPRITKSLNQSLVPDQVFMPVLIKIIKLVDIGAQSHLQFPDDWWRLQFSFCSSPLLYPRICWSTHTHTHTHMHMFTQYIHPSTQHNKKRDSVEPNGGRSRET